MRLQDLIEELQCLMVDHGGDLEVGFSYNYGDRLKTKVVEKVSRVETGWATWSAYHQMMKEVDDSEDGDGHTITEMVIID